MAFADLDVAHPYNSGVFVTRLTLAEIQAGWKPCGGEAEENDGYHMIIFALGEHCEKTSVILLYFFWRNK
jgi:hypothetical protein